MASGDKVGLFDRHWSRVSAVDVERECNLEEILRGIMDDSDETTTPDGECDWEALLEEDDVIAVAWDTLTEEDLRGEVGSMIQRLSSLESALLRIGEEFSYASWSQGIPGLEVLVDDEGILEEEGWQSVLENMGVEVEHHRIEAEMPGGGGMTLVLRASAAARDRITSTLDLMRSRIEEWYAEIDGPGRLAAYEARERATRERARAEQIERRRRTVEELAEKRRVEQETAQRKRLDGLIEHCHSPNGGFHRLGTLLADPDGRVWWITLTAAGNKGHGDWGREVDELRSLGIPVLEVSEAYAPGKERGNIPYFAMQRINSWVGWEQGETRLWCNDSSDDVPQEIRRQYLDWKS